MLAGVALVLSACSGGGGGDGDGQPGGTPVSRDESDELVLQVQPIQVCDDDGIVCAQVEFFEAVADKIWSQANIDIEFLPLNQLNDTTYLTTDTDEFSDMSFSGDDGDFGRHPDSSRTDGPLNLWFVDVIQTSAGLIQFGNAWIGLNGMLVSDDILDFNNGAGRIDVIAHELGHNLGLRHSTFGAGPANNLMSSGARRTIPSSIDNIFPDGDRLSQLTPEQIDRARSSSFLTTSAGDSAPLPITEADAVSLATSPAALSMDTITQVTSPAALSADAVITQVTSPTALSADAVGLATPAALPDAKSSTPVSVPEGSPSWLTWLLLMFLGQRVYSQINR